MEFAGKLAVVTGAARGIGRAIAAALVSEKAAVVLIDIRREELEETVTWLRQKDGRVHSLVCDLGVDEAVTELGKLNTAIGVPDLVFNNAYIPILGGVENIDMEDWRTAFEVNLLGYVRVVKAFAAGMIARGSGHFINTVSPMGLVVEAPAGGFMLPYCASKGADIGFSHALSVALQPHGVGVSLFYPDVTNSWAGKPRGDVPPEFLEALESLIKGGATTESSAAALLNGLREDRFLISAEPGFEHRLVEAARAGFNPARIQFATTKEPPGQKNR